MPKIRVIVQCSAKQQLRQPTEADGLDGNFFFFKEKEKALPLCGARNWIKEG